MRVWQTVKKVYHNTFNIRFAVISAVFNGIWVMAKNNERDLPEQLSLGITQAVASFFSTGVTARVVQHFSPLPNTLLAYAGGSIVPATLTAVMSVGAHLIIGNAEPVSNSLMAIGISFVTSFGTNFVTRRGFFRPPNYPTTRP